MKKTSLTHWPLIALSVGGLLLSRSVKSRKFADRIRESCMNAADEW